VASVTGGGGKRFELAEIGAGAGEEKEMAGHRFYFDVILWQGMDRRWSIV